MELFRSNFLLVSVLAEKLAEERLLQYLHYVSPSDKSPFFQK